jgi:hypothetical protein
VVLEQVLQAVESQHYISSLGGSNIAALRETKILQIKIYQLLEMVNLHHAELVIGGLIITGAWDDADLANLFGMNLSDGRWLLEPYWGHDIDRCPSLPGIHVSWANLDPGFLLRHGILSRWRWPWMCVSGSRHPIWLLAPLKRCVLLGWLRSWLSLGLWD